MISEKKIDINYIGASKEISMLIMRLAKEFEKQYESINLADRDYLTDIEKFGREKLLRYYNENKFYHGYTTYHDKCGYLKMLTETEECGSFSECYMGCPGLKERVKQLWEDFNKVPVKWSESYLVITTDWYKFPKGTKTLDIYNWFELQFSSFEINFKDFIEK